MGTYTEILKLEKEVGLDLLLELNNILSILLQEEELDSKNGR